MLLLLLLFDPFSFPRLLLHVNKVEIMAVKCWVLFPKFILNPDLCGRWPWPGSSGDWT